MYKERKGERMKKKLLAGILALALCSANMPLQTIFAEEFTSGNPDVVSEEETPEIFTNEEQEAAGETDEDLSVFGSEEIPEFNDAPDEAMAAAENAQNGVIDLTDATKVTDGVYTITSIGDHRFTCSNEQTTTNRIVVDGTNTSEQDNINIYLDNVNIKTSVGPALQINNNVEATVTIYLTGTNNLITTNSYSAGLQKDNGAQPIIISASDTTTGILKASGEYGAGIGGGSDRSCNSITINSGFVDAKSVYGAGIGGGYSASCNNITINSGFVDAKSEYGAGIGGGSRGSCDNITIKSGSVNAKSKFGAGIGGGNYGSCNNITINSGSVNAESKFGAGIGGGSCNNIIINSGSVNAESEYGAGIYCTPHKNLDSSGKYDPNIPNVYLCTILNEETKPITIDATPWIPSSHIAVDPNDKNLYAWLTGETHTISVGDTTQTYYFNKKDNTFVPINFTFAAPRNLVYDGHSKDASLTTSEKIGDFTLSYYNEQNELCTSAINAGTYRVKADINNDTYTFSDLVNTDWTFTITKANQAPGFPDNTPISVSWSCKKVGDITNILPKHWIWKYTDESKALEVGIPICATAVYAGTDAGNYAHESVEFEITRSKCTHEHTAGRYYSSPSCTSSGYSGDTYCTDCNETLSYGYTISAYGHDYDNGVITTEPTAETDGIITYTCKRCKHQDTKNLGKLGDGEPYIEGSFQKKGWDAVNDLIKASNEKDTISVTLNGAKVLPASVLSGIKGKDISLNLDMENGFIWKINGTSITAETPADTDLSVTNTAEYIPAALYSLISANQNDFGFHLGRSGAFDFPAVLSVKADASCAGLMANLFWYDAENGVLQCIQTVTVGGAFERSIPYADFTLSKGQDYFMAFGTESLNGRVIHTDGSITDENGAYLRPANTKISSHSIDRNKLTVKLSKGCAGAQGYDFVISKKSKMLQTGKFSQTVSSTGKPQASFRYLAKGTWYVAARSWVLDAQGNKVYGSWTKVKKIKITVVTPQQPKIRNITVKGNTVTITYTKCKNATGYEILLGNKYKISAGEKYPVKKHLKRTGNTTTVTFTNVKKGTWYVTIRAWNQTSKDKSRVYSPYSAMKKFKTKK